MARDDRRQGAEDRAPAADLHRQTRGRLRADRAAVAAPPPSALTWKLTVRAGARVERANYDALDQALDALEQRVAELAQRAPKAPVDVRYKRFEPGEQVAARLELAGPERLLPSTRAGVDVRGDGSTEAYLGRVRRQLLDQRKGETAYQALRRALENRH